MRPTTEANLAWHNAVHGKKSRMNYLTVPHAVFSYPEIASVGLREEQAVKVMGKEQVLVGTAKYSDVARGEAIGTEKHSQRLSSTERAEKSWGITSSGPRRPSLSRRSSMQWPVTVISGHWQKACTSTRLCLRLS